MSNQDLKNWILSLTQDIEFTYNGVHGAICPFSVSNISVAFGKENFDYDDIDKLMNDKIFDGESLDDISEKIEFL